MSPSTDVGECERALCARSSHQQVNGRCQAPAVAHRISHCRCLAPAVTYSSSNEGATLDVERATGDRCGGASPTPGRSTDHPSPNPIDIAYIPNHRSPVTRPHPKWHHALTHDNLVSIAPLLADLARRRCHVARRATAAQHCSSRSAARSVRSVTVLRGRVGTSRVPILRCVFPSSTKARGRRLVRRTFASTGIGAVETAIAWFGDIGPLRRTRDVRRARCADGCTTARPWRDARSAHISRRSTSRVRCCRTRSTST